MYSLLYSIVIASNGFTVPAAIFPEGCIRPKRPPDREIPWDPVHLRFLPGIASEYSIIILP